MKNSRREDGARVAHVAHNHENSGVQLPPAQPNAVLMAVSFKALCANLIKLKAIKSDIDPLWVDILCPEDIVVVYDYLDRQTQRCYKEKI